MTLWQKVKKGWKSLCGTIVALPVFLAAIWAIQQPTPTPPLPLKQVAALTWVSTNAYLNSVTVSGVTYSIFIRSGATTDLASIPIKLQELLGLSNSSPSISRGAWEHDGLYSTMDQDGSGVVSKAVADQILYAEILKDGMDQAKAAAVLRAVDLWGWTVLLRHTTDSVNQARRLVTVSAR